MPLFEYLESGKTNLLWTFSGKASSLNRQVQLAQKVLASFCRILFEIAAACRIKKLEPETALRRYAQTVVDELEASAEG